MVYLQLQGEISNGNIKLLQKFYEKVFYNKNFRTNIDKLDDNMKNNSYIKNIIDFINADKKRPISLPLM